MERRSVRRGVALPLISRHPRSAHRALALLLGGVLFPLAATVSAQAPAPAQQPVPAPSAKTASPPKPGVPGIRENIADLKPQTIYPVEGSPDWLAITPEATWVASARANQVVQLRAEDGKVGLIASVNRPCSGLTAAFGSIWSPSCRDKKLMRIDPATGAVIASVDADPENSEGGITSGAGSVWMVVKPSTLIRVNPQTNTVIARIPLPSTAADPVFGDGFVWVTTFTHNTVVKVDPRTGTVVATVPTGPSPRFLTFGGGSVWTLNQGDGTVTRIDAKTDQVLATIPCGIPGEGGDLSYADGYVWAALFDFPLTEIDAATNKPIHQWAGPGGDGMRAGGGSVWLSNLKQGTVWRIPVNGR